MRREEGGEARPGRREALSEARRADIEHLKQLRRMRQVRAAKVLVALAALVILILFIIQNSERVEVDYVFLSRESRLIWIILSSALLGGIIGFLVGRPGKQFRFHGEEPSRPSGEEGREEEEGGETA